MRLNDSVELYY